MQPKVYNGYFIDYIGQERLTSCTLDIKLILIVIVRFCRGELFRPNEKSFATFHHSDFVEENFSDQMKNLLLLFITLILQVLQALARATFYHINALSDIC